MGKKVLVILFCITVILLSGCLTENLFLDESAVKLSSREVCLLEGMDYVSRAYDGDYCIDGNSVWHKVKVESGKVFIENWELKNVGVEK